MSEFRHGQVRASRRKSFATRNKRSSSFNWCAVRTNLFLVAWMITDLSCWSWTITNAAQIWYIHGWTHESRGTSLIFFRVCLENARKWSLSPNWVYCASINKPSSISRGWLSSKYGYSIARTVPRALISVIIDARDLRRDPGGTGFFACIVSRVAYAP
jgi:hypothetical protein